MTKNINPTIPTSHEVLFENAAFIVVDKPSGSLSVPSRMGEEEARPCLMRDLSKDRRLWAVHRLDFEVSGVILFAKSAESHRAANTWFETHLVKKTYRALTELGAQKEEPPKDWIRWESKILRGKKRAYEKPFGKQAITHAKTLCMLQYKKHSVLEWELRPETGRSHQLRFELAKHSYPIVGDALYGSQIPFETSAIALISYSIDFQNCPEAPGLGLPNVISIRRKLWTACD